MKALLSFVLPITMLMSVPLMAEEFQASPGPVIPFRPFKIGDFCLQMFNGTCEVFYTSAGQKYQDQEVYEGTIGEYVAYLNQMEQHYNQTGKTLHPEKSDAADETNYPMQIPTDAKELESQLLFLLNLNTEKVLQTVLGLDPKAECPFLALPGRDIEDPNFRFTRYSVPGLNDMPFDDIIRRFNEHQNILCPLGMSLFDKLDPKKRYRPKELIGKLLEVRDEILKKLGLSEYSSAFTLEAVQQIQAGIDVARDIENLIAAREIPSPEQLMELQQKLNVALPEEWDIPDVPNIPSPVPPSPRPLEVKKRKDWSGFNYGDRSLMATYANAYLELKGSEDAQQATAFGAAGVYILNNEINALGGYATGYAGPEEISLKMELKAFGQNIMPPKSYKGSVQIVKNEPKAFAWDLDKSYEKTFMAGPVPVTVTLGARIGIGMGYEYGIYTTQLKGSVIPFANAEAYASGEAGIPKILSVGAQAELTLLKVSAPLTGYAAVKFDEVGYPYLKMGIESHVDYTTLKGRAFAFANYIVPRLGIPPIKKKRAEYELFDWAGTTSNISIMNWGLELGRNGTYLSGDLLDQTDRKEAELLTEAVNLDQKKEAVHNLQVEALNKANAVFQGMHADMNSDANKNALQYSGYLGVVLKDSAAALDDYNGKMTTFFQERSKKL